MANTVFKLRRSSVAGKKPTTSDIAIGEQAINLTDRILYSSDGTNVWEIGANNTTVNVTNSITVATNSITNSSGIFTNKVNAASHTVGTAAFVANTSGVYTNNNINVTYNDRGITFTPLAGGANVGFRQQSDDNFVFYSTNTTNGQRAIFNVYANTNSGQGSALRINVPLDIVSNPLYANGSAGSDGQVLASNGSATYWTSVGGTGTVTSVGSGTGLTGGPITASGTLSVNTGYDFTWSNVHTFNANVSFSNSIGIASNNAIYLGGLSDANWKIARNSGSLTKWVYTNNTIDIVTANSPYEGFAIGLVSNATYFETGYLGTYVAKQLVVGDSSVNTTINATSFTGTSNNSSYLGGNLPSYYTNATNITTGTLPYAQLGTNVVNTTGSFTLSGVTTFNANIVLGSSGLSANGSYGSAGQSLLSNGSATYWATAGATLNANNTDTQTFYIGLSNASTGAWTNAVVSTTKLYYVPSTGKLDSSIVNSSSFTVGTAFTANATVVNAVSYYAGSTLIGNTTGPYGKTEGNLNVNNSLTSNTATYLGNSSGTIANVSSWITTNASAAYTNAVSYTDGVISNVNSAITANASAAYTNATIFASNASNINTGTIAEARLPYRMNQNVTTSNDVTFGSLTLTGNLTVSGNVVVIGANNLSIVDNFIYLNSNNTTQNIDIGIAANYNDGSYHHTGVFRDASDGIWKVFDNYDPEPDANVNIDTSNTSFHLANFQANTLYLGNTSTNWLIANTGGAYVTGTVNAASHTVGTAFSANATVVNAVSYYAGTTLIGNTTGPYGKTEANLNVNNALTANNTTYVNSKTEGNLNVNNALTANNSSYLNGQLAAYYTNASNITTGTLPYAQIPANVINTTAAFTISGVHTHSANIILGSSGLSSNGGFGTSGHVLHSNGTATYWAADDQGVTSVATGNGLTGGTISSTGTVSVLANTGIVANATGLYVNATYIGTLSANNTTYVNGKAEANLNVNSAVTVTTNTSSNTFTIGTASYFLSNGNFGIGTSTPSTKFYVSTGTTGGIAILQGSARTIFFEDDGTGSRISTEGTGRFAIRAAGSGGNHLVVAANGNIGIANSTPAQTLSVTGSGYFGTNTTLGFEMTTWSGGSTYYGITAPDHGTSEYFMLTGGQGDKNMYLSTYNGSKVYIRGGNNVSTYEIQVSGTSRPTVGGTNSILDTGGNVNLTGGFTTTSYNLGTGSGTVTPTATNGNYQYITNNGAFTLANPTSDCAIDILVTNGASAGTITFSGFTAPSGGGADTYATTNGNRYILLIRRINAVSTYAWKALQ